MEVRSSDARRPDPQVVGAVSGAAAGGGELRYRSPKPAPPAEEEDDEEFLGGVRQEAPTDEERHWGMYIVVGSFLDIISSGGVVITCVSYAYRDIGVTLWCMAIQATSHWLSSVLLALRFCGESSLPGTDEASAYRILRQRRRRFLVREQIVSIAMGLVMLLSSAGLLFKAFRKMKFWHSWYQDQLQREAMDSEAQWVIEFLAWYGFSFYFLQAIFRFIAARKVKRGVVWHTFAASVVSLLFLLVMGLAASYQKEWSWKAEPIAAIVLSFVTLIEGIRIVISYLDDMDTRLRHDSRA